jgi:hypothetical protein
MRQIGRKLGRFSLWFFGIIVGIMLLISGGLYVFKDEICGKVVQEANKYLNTKVTVADVDLTFWGTFPNLSVDLNQVFIRDAVAKATDRDTLLYTDQIRLKFNAMDIWRENYTVKSIEIAKGTLQLKIDSAGADNYTIFKPSNEKASGAEIKLNEVLVSGLRFNYINQATGQRYRTHIHQLAMNGKFTDTRYTIHASSSLNVRQAKSGDITLISNKKAAFDLELNVDNEKGTIDIPEARIYVANLPFRVKGAVTNEAMDFEVHADDVQLEDIANNMVESETKDIKRFEGTGNVFFNLLIHGNRTTTDPTEIECDFGVSNGSLREPTKKLRISKVHVAGKYSNKGGRDKEFLQLNELDFTTPAGPFKANMRITHFDAPEYRGKANGVLSLKMVHALFNLPYVETVSGQVRMSTDFGIQTRKVVDGQSYYSVDHCTGDLKMNDVNLKLEDDKRTFAHMNGTLFLHDEEAGIDHVSLSIGSTDLRINGVFGNIMNYVGQAGALKAQVEIQSDYINVADLGTTSKEEKIQEGNTYMLPSDICANIDLSVGRIDYEGHTFRGVDGQMEVKNREINFPSLSLRNADADVRGNLIIKENSPERFQIATHFSTNNLNFKALFKEWNNFRQDVIGEDNISGVAQAEGYFEAPFHLKTGIVSDEIRSEVHLKLSNGRLRNVGAFKSITESLKSSASTRLSIGKENISLLDRKLQDLQFETLENTFIIRNSRLEIPSMTIRSSALDMDVSGTHTFSNKIDYRFAFRFRDLKEKSVESEFGEEVDDGTGMKVYMRMFGDLDNPTIEWDKTGRKQQAAENRAAEKETVKAMLKSEFGLFKADSTVKTYQPKQMPKEELHIELSSPLTKPSDTDKATEKKKQKSTTKQNKTINGWKKESEESKEEEIEFN